MFYFYDYLLSLIGRTTADALSANIYRINDGSSSLFYEEKWFVSVIGSFARESRIIFRFGNPSANIGTIVVTIYYPVYIAVKSAVENQADLKVKKCAIFRVGSHYFFPYFLNLNKLTKETKNRPIRIKNNVSVHDRFFVDPNWSELLLCPLPLVPFS